MASPDTNHENPLRGQETTKPTDEEVRQWFITGKLLGILNCDREAEDQVVYEEGTPRTQQES